MHSQLVIFLCYLCVMCNRPHYILSQWILCDYHFSHLTTHRHTSDERRYFPMTAAFSGNCTVSSQENLKPEMKGQQTVEINPRLIYNAAQNNIPSSWLRASNNTPEVILTQEKQDSARVIKLWFDFFWGGICLKHVHPLSCVSPVSPLQSVFTFLACLSRAMTCARKNAGWEFKGPLCVFHSSFGSRPLTSTREKQGVVMTCNAI